MTLPPDIPEQELRTRCARLLEAASEEARRLGHPYIGVEHLFISATKRESGPTAQLLKQAGFNPRQVRNEIRRDVGTGEGAPDGGMLMLTPRALIVLSLALFTADHEKSDQVQEGDMLLAMLQEGESVPMRKLVEMGFDVNRWLQKILTDVYEHDRQFPSPPPSGSSTPDILRKLDLKDADLMAFESDLQEMFFSDDAESSHDVFPRRDALGNRSTPLLDKYGRDLSAQAAQGRLSPAIARDREIRAVARTLARSKKNNPLLLGDAGVGKTAVVEGLAYAIQNGSAPPSLRDKRIVQLEIGTLVAGTSLRGQFEERLIGLVEEARGAGNVILFIDEIHTIVGAGDTIDSNLDAANILKPALARGDLMCIGATTHAEYRRAIAQDPALDRRFRAIDIEEPNEVDAMAIVSAQRERLETHHHVTITPAAIETAVRLSAIYLPDRRLPDKAIDLLDEACARVIIRTQSPDDEAGTEVLPINVTAVLSDWSGIPVSEMTKDEKRRLSEIDPVLLGRVIGQDDAVRLVSAAIKTARAGLREPHRPVGVFLFLGPSGVGKTELARALSGFLFGSDDAMLRLDMSEFHDAHTAARLTGAPPGYRESQRGGQLTDWLRRRPYSVILLDEVEKAAPEIFDLFLQVFDEGRVSDAHGGQVDARHAVFIMTSNIGTQDVGKGLGFMGGADYQPDYSAHLRDFFRPEFLNRVDEVVTFKPLTGAVLAQILDLQMSDLHRRLREQRLTLTLSEDARALILRKGYDPANGARPLRRAIERLLTRPLSARIVEDTFTAGDIILATAEGEGLHFEIQRTLQSA